MKETEPNPSPGSEPKTPTNKKVTNKTNKENLNPKMEKKNSCTAKNNNIVQPKTVDPELNPEIKDNVPVKNVVAKPSKSSFDIMEPGDLAWARLGTAPFWPCIITRDLDLHRERDLPSETSREFRVQVNKNIKIKIKSAELGVIHKLRNAARGGGGG